MLRLYQGVEAEGIEPSSEKATEQSTTRVADRWF